MYVYKPIRALVLNVAQWVDLPWFPTTNAVIMSGSCCCKWNHPLSGLPFSSTVSLGLYHLICTNEVVSYRPGSADKECAGLTTPRWVVTTFFVLNELVCPLGSTSNIALFAGSSVWRFFQGNHHSRWQPLEGVPAWISSPFRKDEMKFQLVRLRTSTGILVLHNQNSLLLSFNTSIATFDFRRIQKHGEAISTYRLPYTETHLGRWC